MVGQKTSRAGWSIVVFPLAYDTTVVLTTGLKSEIQKGFKRWVQVGG